MTDALVPALHALLGDDLLGVYRHGSEVLGGGGVRSDIDVLAVSRRHLTGRERARVVELCETVPRIEFDLVVASELKPWRHPAPYDLHYWYGRKEALGPGTNTDLAAVVTMTLAGNRTLFGPPPAELFDPVPQADFVDGILRDADDSNVLMLAKTWAGVETGQPYSKLRAADWAVARLPETHRQALEEAKAYYRGERDDAPDAPDELISYVRRAIRSSRP